MIPPPPTARENLAYFEDIMDDTVVQPDEEGHLAQNWLLGPPLALPPTLRKVGRSIRPPPLGYLTKYFNVIYIYFICFVLRFPSLPSQRGCPWGCWLCAHLVVVRFSRKKTIPFFLATANQFRPELCL